MRRLAACRREHRNQRAQALGMSRTRGRHGDLAGHAAQALFDEDDVRLARAGVALDRTEVVGQRLHARRQSLGLLQ